jgi:hypothetical protein
MARSFARSAFVRRRMRTTGQQRVGRSSSHLFKSVVMVTGRTNPVELVADLRDGFQIMRFRGAIGLVRRVRQLFDIGFQSRSRTRWGIISAFVDSASVAAALTICSQSSSDLGERSCSPAASITVPLTLQITVAAGLRTCSMKVFMSTCGWNGGVRTALFDIDGDGPRMQ